MPATDTPTTPDPLKTQLTYLDKRVFCILRDSNKILHLGLVGKTSLGARNPPEFIQFQIEGSDTYINASLIRVTDRMVYYRQVMSEGKTNFEGNNQINDKQR